MKFDYINILCASFKHAKRCKILCHNIFIMTMIIINIIILMMMIIINIIILCVSFKHAKRCKILDL